MGWEWHNRRRNSRGQYDALAPLPDKQQVHIRMPYKEAQAVREAARAAQEELSDYVRRAIALRMQRDGTKNF